MGIHVDMACGVCHFQTLEPILSLMIAWPEHQAGPPFLVGFMINSFCACIVILSFGPEHVLFARATMFVCARFTCIYAQQNIRN